MSTIKVHLFVYGKVESRDIGERLIAVTPNISHDWVNTLRRLAALGSITTYAAWRGLDRFSGLGVFNYQNTVIFSRLSKPPFSRGIDNQEFDPLLYQWAMINAQDAAALGGDWRPIFDLMRQSTYGDDLVANARGQSQIVEIPAIHFTVSESIRTAGIEASVAAFYRWFGDRHDVAFSLAGSLSDSQNATAVPVCIRGLSESEDQRLEFASALTCLYPPSARGSISFATRTTGTKECAAHFKFLDNGQPSELPSDRVFNLTTGAFEQGGTQTVSPYLSYAYSRMQAGADAFRDFLLDYDEPAARHYVIKASLKSILNWVSLFISADNDPTPERIVKLLHDRTLRTDEYLPICGRVVDAMIARIVTSDGVITDEAEPAYRAMLQQLIDVSAQQKREGLIAFLLAHLNPAGKAAAEGQAAIALVDVIRDINEEADVKIASTSELRPLAKAVAEMLLAEPSSDSDVEATRAYPALRPADIQIRESQTMFIAAIDPGQFAQPGFYEQGRLGRISRTEILPLLLFNLQAYAQASASDEAFGRAVILMNRLLELSGENSTAIRVLREYIQTARPEQPPSEIAGRIWTTLKATTDDIPKQVGYAAAVINAYPGSEWHWIKPALDLLVTALIDPAAPANARSPIEVGSARYQELITFLAGRRQSEPAEALIMHWLNRALDRLARAKDPNLIQDSLAQLTGLRIAVKSLLPSLEPKIDAVERSRMTGLSVDVLRNIILQSAEQSAEANSLHESLQREAEIASRVLFLQSVIPQGGYAAFAKRTGEAADLLDAIATLDRDVLRGTLLDFETLDEDLLALIAEKPGKGTPDAPHLTGDRLIHLANDLLSLRAEFEDEIQRGGGALSGLRSRETIEQAAQAIYDGERAPRTRLGVLFWLAGALSRAPIIPPGV